MNPESAEDEALLYVLGELTPGQRQEFEARLAESSELRSLLHDLEEGTVAAAMAAPPKLPPSAAWKGIEKSIAQQPCEHARPARWIQFLKSGWAAAGACLLGWILYAWWVDAPARQLGLPQSTKETPLVSNSSFPSNDHELPAPAVPANEAAHSSYEPQSHAADALQWQVRALENRVAYLSEALARHQSALSETNRIRFVRASGTSANGQGAAIANLSPGLQRALMLAVARQLGWNSGADLFESNLPLSEKYPGVDFVDFDRGTNATSRPIAAQPAIQSGMTDSAPTENAGRPEPAVPAFVSGETLVVAIDSTVVPQGSELTFSNGDASQTIGMAFLGENPLVATLSLSGFSSRTFILTATSVSGVSQVFQISVEGTPP